MTWRVGTHYGIHIYEDDRPVATFFREDEARHAADLHNVTIATVQELTESEKIEAAAIYLFPDWDKWPAHMHAGIRERLFHILTWSERLMKAEPRIAELEEAIRLFEWDACHDQERISALEAELEKIRDHYRDQIRNDNRG